MAILKRIFFSAFALLFIFVVVTAWQSPGGFKGAWTQIAALTGLNTQEVSASQSNSLLNVPDGFSVQVFAENVGHTRFMEVTPNQALLVSSVETGVIWLLEDNDDDKVADSQTVILSGLKHPQGMAFFENWLYVGEKHQIIRVPFNSSNNAIEGEVEVVVADLPAGHPHWSHNVKTIGFSPDGWLHVNIGSPCNVCVPSDERFSTMMRFKPDGSEGHIYARGLRNSEGFDWAPWNDELFATDNGRDMLGDDFPPCELNKIEQNGFYGWPYINGTGVLDPDEGVGKESLLATAISPAFEFNAHNAPLGMAFNRSNALPDGFEKSAFVALHGSWNRSELDGYKVLSLHWDDAGNITGKNFLDGFIQPNGVIGRPVDVAQANDGTLFVSDDLTGRVYAVTVN